MFLQRGGFQNGLQMREEGTVESGQGKPRIQAMDWGALACEGGQRGLRGNHANTCRLWLRRGRRGGWR